MKNKSTTSIGLVTALVTIFLISLSIPVQSAMPTGSLGYGTLGGVGQNIYDLSSTYTVVDRISQGDGTYLDIAFDVIMVQDGKGKIDGTGVTTMEIEDQESTIATINGNYEVKGKIKAADGVTFVMLKVVFTGNGMLLGEIREMVFRTTQNLTVDTFNRALVGISKGKAKPSGLESAQVESLVMEDLPNNVDGTWSLALNIQPVDGKLVGSGQIQLPNDNNLPLEVIGKYSDKTDLSKLKTKGITTGLGSKLKVELVDNNLNSFKGKIMGQKVEWAAVIP